MANLEKILAVTPKHSLDTISISNGAVTNSIQFDAGSMAREPLFIDPEHCIVPKGERYLAILNTKSGQVKQQWACPEQLKSLHITNNKAYLFGGAISGKVYIWHFTTGELLRIFDAHYKGVAQLTTNEDDSILITTGLDGTVHVWNILTLLDVRELNSVTAASRLKTMVEFSRHSMPITSLIAPTGTANAGKLFTASLDRTVIEYCISSKTVRQMWTLPAPVLCMCLHPTQTQLFVGCTNNEIYIIPLYDTTHYPALNNNVAHANSANPSSSSSSHPTSSTTAGSSSTISTGGTYIPSNSVYKQQTNTNTSNLFGSGHVFPSFVGHTHHVTSVAISLHGTHLVSSSLDGNVIIWSIGSRQVIKQINPHPGKHYPISAVKILIDTPASLRVTDDMLRKKQFPPMLRDLRTPLELTNDQTNLRFGTNCFTTIPLIPQFSTQFQVYETLDDMTYHDHLLALVDAENAIADVNGDVTTMTTPNTMFRPQKQSIKGGTKRSHSTMGDDDDNSDTNNTNDSDSDDGEEKNKNNNNKRAKKNGGKKGEDNDLENDLSKAQAQKIAELEAEVKKWKVTATKLYKQAK